MRLHHLFAAFTLAVTFSLTASADVITDWNIVAIDAARSFGNPNPATRAIAIGHLAAYEAVSAINQSGEPYLPGAITVTAPASVEAAAIAAFHDALVFAIPAKKADIDKAAEKALEKIADGAAKTNGTAAGTAAAAKIVTERTGDGADDIEEYLGEDAVGKWRPTPPANAAANTPQWATLKPFSLTSANQFDPGPPPSITSSRYATDLLELKFWGGATGSSRSADQTNIAKFWAQQTHLPLYQLARTFSKSNELTVDQNARFFGQLSLALADARIAAWNAKYEYGLWRPITAINSQVDDGNLDTTPDPEGDWAPLLETPNHPDYVSGHSATGAAGAAVLAAWFGDENSFAVTSETLVGAAFTRSYDRFSDIAEENALSRVYGGIHYRFSNEAGLALGEDVAAYVLANELGAFPDNGQGGAGGAGGAGGEAGAAVDEVGGAAGAPTTNGGASGSATAGSGGSGSTQPEPSEGGQAPIAEGGAGSSTEGGAPSTAGKAGSPSDDDSEGDSCSVANAGGPGSAAGLLLIAGATLALGRRRQR